MMGYSTCNVVRARRPSSCQPPAAPRLLPILIAAALASLSPSGRAQLVINEVCYDNSTLADETGNTSSDWIELYNAGSSGVNVLNYAVGDANPYEESKGVRLPSYTIPPGGFLVVFASPDLPEYTAWTNAPNTGLIAPNSTWRHLTPSSAPPATWRDRVFDDSAWPSGIAPLGYNDRTLHMDCATILGYGGDPTNRYPAAYFRKTFKAINPSVITGLELKARANDGMIVYLNGNEWFRHNMPSGPVSHATPASMSVPSTLWTTNLLPTTWLLQGANVLAVEVHQASPSSVDLILDLILTAHIQESVPVVHGQFGLGKDGENVHLFQGNLQRIHRFLAPGYEIGENKSYGLAVDGATASSKVFEKPSPGLSNATYDQKYSPTLTAQKPVFSVPPGIYAASQNVVLTTPTAGYKIYYTLDGSSPWDSTTFVYSGSPVAIQAASPATSGLAWIRNNPVEIVQSVPDANWQAPIGSIPKAVVLRAIAVSADNRFCSPETRGTYFIGPQFASRPLPIFSLITDMTNLFGFTSGIYVPGKCYADSAEGYGSNRWGKPYANYHQDDGQVWERPVQLELFETSQTTAAFSQLLGLTMHGGGTRAIPQKALYLLARLGEYGADQVSYPLFPDEPPASYKRFLLRSSGNDWYGPDYAGIATMLKDAVFHSMVKGLDTSVMAYRPAVAYFNGEYWGIHNIRESFDKHYLATRYGLNPDNCDILMHEEDPLDNDKVRIERIDGDTNADEEYEALIDWIQVNPISIPAHYLQLQASIDVTNYADYIVAETFFANTDWPINNCDFWRAHTNQVASSGKYGDTRWRWMLYDLDVAGAEGPDFDMFEYLSSSKMTGGHEPGFLINQLWANMDFRNHFVTRYMNLLNTTFRPDRLAGIVAQAADVIAPEIENHFRRWGRSHSQAQWRQAVQHVLVQYTATRHEVSWQHLNDFFALGGTGALTVRNSDPAGTGGRFAVNGISIDSATEGVTNRALWTGTFFRSLPVPVQAIPDTGYRFDGWAGTAVTNPTPSLFVGDAPITLTARFRPSSAPAYTPTGYEQWQVANYSDLEILGSAAASPSAPSGCAGLSNFELYAFGMHRNDGLTDSQRLARASLSIEHRTNALWISYTRLNSSFTDVRYKLKTAPHLNAPIPWADAVAGQDLDGASITNVLDSSTWRCQVQLASPSASYPRFFQLEAAPQ